MTIPSKPSYTHGSVGSAPSSALDYASNDPVDSENFDYFINTEFSYINSLIDALNAIDSDNDEKVDAADFADDAGNVTGTYKGQDIDADGDGVVNRAEQVEGADGEFHSVGSLPQFADNSTAVSNTSEGNLFYNTSDNNAYINVGGSAQYLSAKTVNILVNGTQEGSFTQEETPRDYNLDISAADTTSMQTLADAKLNANIGEDSGSANAGFDIPSTAPSNATANASLSANTDTTATLQVNGSVVLDISTKGGSGSWSGTVNPGDDITVTLDVGAANDNPTVSYDFNCELVDGATVVVNSVTQS